MRYLITIAVASMLVVKAAPLIAAPGAAPARAAGVQASTTITGAVHTAAGETLPDYRVQVRDLQTGKVAGTSTSNAEGAYSFTGLAAGSYVVEVVRQTGEVLGCSAVVASANRVSRTTIALPGSPAAAQAASAGAVAPAAALVSRAAASAGILAVASPSGRPDASPSR